MLALRLAATVALTLACGMACAATEKSFLEGFQKHKAALLGAKTVERRAAELKKLNAFLEQSFTQARGTDAHERVRLKTTIAALQSYLSEIDPRKLDAPGCAAARNRIRFSADPRAEEESTLSGEAREALSILAALCQR